MRKMKFRDLAIGSRFVFASEIENPLSGAMKGDWYKTSVRCYKYHDTEVYPYKLQVGTINVDAYELPEKESPKMEPTKLSPNDAGCYFDSHRGIYIYADIVDFAESYGMELSEDDKNAVSAWREGNAESDSVIEMSDEAETFLNDTLAPEGYSFGWYEGDWGLYPDITCDYCELLMINGVLCHETGCKNQGATWEDGTWVKYTECAECGNDVREGESCCEETEDILPDPLADMRDEDGTLPAYSFPGMYPLFYIDNDGDIMCPKCANEGNYSTYPVDCGANYEDTSLYCCYCSQRIESAYCEDEQETPSPNVWINERKFEYAGNEYTRITFGYDLSEDCTCTFDLLSECPESVQNAFHKLLDGTVLRVMEVDFAPYLITVLAE